MPESSEHAAQPEEYLRAECTTQPLLHETPNLTRWDQPEPAFVAGELVGGRFRIVRELGRGGMGVVYDAWDQKLHRRIALKCAQVGFQNRLPPEARAALEISHPNVCKLHELHTAETDSGPMDFLTMEFVDGENLAQRIHRTGPLAEPEARAIALQVCAGLAQVHRQGVIHGDLKPGNLILSRSPKDDVRAVLTDFGLARLSDAPGGRHAMSGLGGTRDYMAPELFQGARASIASDIYALGVLLRNMLTGDQPGAKRLPPRWERIVTRCLQPDPEARFGSVEEVSAALSGRRAVTKWLLAAALLTIVALVGTLWFSTRESPGAPVRLAVLPLTVEGPPIPAASGIGADVANRLTGLRRRFAVISPAEALRNQADTPDKARSVLGATHVLRTALHNSGGRIRAQASISDIGAGTTLGELKGDYAPEETGLLAKALIASVTRTFGLRGAALQETVSGPAHPSYVQGVAFMQRDNVSADQAIPFFEKAREIDPRSALPYAGLAEAHLQKFRRGAGRQWLESAGPYLAKAKSINPDSAPVLLASGYFQQENGGYEQAIAEFVRATQLDPGNPEAWRGLAMAYEKTNRTTEAAGTYRKAIEAQPTYYRPYVDFGNFYLYRSQFKQAEEQYRHVTQYAPNLASGHMNLGLALMEQGIFPEAEKELLAALALRRTANGLLNVGALYYEQERFAEAARFFKESLEAGPPNAIRYRDMGDAYRHLGRINEAREAYLAGRTAAENDLARNPRQGVARVVLAFLSAQLGDARQARLELSEALSFEPENAMVMREAVMAYEVLGERENALNVLSRAPRSVLEELNRQPDVKSLRHDPRFQAMMQKNSVQ